MQTSSLRSLVQNDDSDEDTLSDEQVKGLLERAERRLCSTESLNHHISDTLAPQKLPRLDVGPIAQPYVLTTDGVAWANPSRLLSNETKRASDDARRVASLGRQSPKAKQSDAGFDFFSMPATNASPEFRADMRMIKVRGVLDPHRHYKKETSENLLPKYSEVGRIIEDSTERYSARLPNKERHRTFLAEVLANETSTHRFKDKYGEIQLSRTSGKKGYYQKLKSKKHGGIRKS